MHPIVCEKVSKAYRTKRETVIALEEISLDVREGEVMMLIGPSGAGKSSLLRLIAGLIKPDRGEISLLGEDLALMAPRRKAEFFAHHVGMVFEDLPLFDTFNIEDNILLSLIYNKTSGKLRPQIVQKMLVSMGMTQRSKSFPKELSQGEKQIIALARALVHEPKILILDDPFSLLDHQMGMKLMTLLRSFALDKGTAVILASHDARLYPFAHRLVKMQEGKVLDIIGEAAVFEPPPPYMRI